MHSLKNTIVAVGLLGISFLFYQASSNKSSDESDLLPALEISDGLGGLKGLASNGTDAEQSKMELMPGIEIPDLTQPKQLISDLATNDGENINPKVSPLKKNANEFDQHSSADSAKFAAQLSSDDFLPGVLPNPPIKQKSNPSAPTIKSPAALPPRQRQPLDRVSRDAGLIEALKSQKQTSPVQPPADSTFESGSKIEPEVEHPFISQPILSSDSSYNQLATDNSNQHKPAVVQADSEPNPVHLTLQAAWPHVDRLVAENEFREALRLLSQYYRSPELTGPQRQQLYGWLDVLAGKVIFSAEHHLQSMPYTVANETLVDIGQRWKVPAQLIFNINRHELPNAAVVAAGTPLKVVQGPFNAEIDMQQKVMTLFLGDLYAGRYSIRVGRSGNPKPGVFRVLVKSATGHSWRDAEGKEYPPGAPENGYGPNWIGLSGSLCIHAVEDSIRDGHRGCIGLSEQDAKDVFAILSDSSSVKIVR